MEIRMTRRDVWILMALVASTLIAGSPTGRAAEELEHVVVLRHERFSPAEVEVGVGESVKWRHEDGDDPQSVTADDGSFDSHPRCEPSAPARCMKGGETFTHTFTRPGRFPYYSRTEGGAGGRGMSGVVVVVEEHDHHDDA